MAPIGPARILSSSFVPRPLAWADRTSPSGSTNAVPPVLQSRLRPEGSPLPAQGNALGTQRRIVYLTLKGSFISDHHPTHLNRLAATATAHDHDHLATAINPHVILTSPARLTRRPPLEITDLANT